MTAVNASEATQDLRIPPAVAEWRELQGLPPIRPRGARRLERARGRGFTALARLAEIRPDIEVSDGLHVDDYGVIRPVTNLAMRRHAARHASSAVSR